VCVCEREREGESERESVSVRERELLSLTQDYVMPNAGDGKNKELDRAGNRVMLVYVGYKHLS